MDDVFTKTLGGLATGGLLYLFLYVFPPIKKKLVEKFEAYLKTKGFDRVYQKLYRFTKSVLIAVLVIMIAGPILFFLYLLIF